MAKSTGRGYIPLWGLPLALCKHNSKLLQKFTQLFVILKYVKNFKKYLDKSRKMCCLKSHILGPLLANDQALVF